MIRPLEPADLAACITLGGLMHEESDYADLEYSPEKCLALGRDAIVREDRLWLVAEQRREVIGMLGAYLEPAYFSAELVAGDYLVYVKPEHRGGLTFIRLVKYFVTWAQAGGARKVYLSTTAKINDAGTLYERMGLEQVGGIYRRNF